ncbi:MAG TPA: tetratricopeptide repeat protein [Candidatus Acidoferrales bacterium]|nr:tetratricopeptide repeat protein [Candidatus Acidoferrales bacterium]
MSTRATSRLIRFGLFEADLENARLVRKGARIRLQEQPFRILSMLLEHPGQIVTREELRQELWPAGTYVDFDGSLNAALKRLRAALDDDADNPRFIETVPKRGYRFIAPVTVEENSPPIESEITAPVGAPATQIPRPVSGPPSTPHKSGRQRIFGVVALLISVTLAAVFLIQKKRPPLQNPATQSNVDLGSTRRSVAILGFQNASRRPEDAWFSTALSEMLRTELGAGHKLRVVPGENIAQLRVDWPLSETDSLSRQTASRIGSALNSDVLVLGSYAAVGDAQSGSVRIDFRLQDAQTGDILYEGSESGSEKQFFGLVAKIGVSLRERLGLPMISESEEAGVVSSLPSDPDANRFYSLGLAKFRDADVAAAKDLFLQAEKLAPRFPLAHLMLSLTWGGLGYDQKAKDEIKTAYDLSSGLPETDKLQIEAAYFASRRDWDQAITAYRTLYTLFPDSVDYAEQFVLVLNNAGRREEALAVLKQLRELPPPASEDPRIDFWQATLIHDSDPAAARSFLDKAIAEAASRGQKLLYARFRLEECIAGIYGNHPQGAEAYCQEAYDIFMAAGNRLYAADALRAMADRRGAQGDFSGARETYQRALAILIPLGEHEKTGVALNNMAITYENQGQIDLAEKFFRQAAETWRECGDTSNEGVALGNVADIVMARGQLRQAEAQYQSARKQIEFRGPANVSYELYNISAIRLYEGDIAGAESYANQALAVSTAHKVFADIAASAAVLGDIRLAQDDLAGARKDYQQSLAIRRQLGNNQNIAENEASLATVSIEEGKLAEAEQSLRKSLAQFESESAVIDEVHTETDLSHVLLKEGKLANARSVISDALKLEAGSSDPSLKLPVAIEDARIQTAEIAARAQNTKSRSDFSAPRRELDSAISTARHLGYFALECDARLASAEIALHENPSGARAGLAGLARAAHQHGMELVARKAAAMQNSSAAAK